MTHYWFISTKYRRSSQLALITFLLAFVVILLGAYTRLTDAGLSCPDWPNCYGYVIAPHTTEQLQTAAQNFPLTPVNVKKAWTEMTHRYFAGSEGILILILAISILVSRKTTDIKSTFIGAMLIVLLATQVLLGMLTVTAKLKPEIVLAHLLTGLAILSFLWWAYLDLHLRDDIMNNKVFANNIISQRSALPLVPLLWFALFIVLAQITLGGWVSSHYAGLACVDFPYCNGQIMPPIQWSNLHTDLISIHMLHRIGALITAAYLSVFALLLLSHDRFRALAKLIFSLIALQVTLGILNVIWLRPVWIALIHQAVAMMLLLTIITALVKATFVMDNHY